MDLRRHFAKENGSGQNRGGEALRVGLRVGEEGKERPPLTEK